MDEAAREAGFRLAGAFRSRRIYAAGAAAAREMVSGLLACLERALATRPRLAFGVLAERLAIEGEVLPDAPLATDRLAERMVALGIEVISFSRGVQLSEIEALLDLLTLPPGELLGEPLDGWLARRGVTQIQVRHLVLEERPMPIDRRSAYRRATRELGDLFGSARNGRVPPAEAFSSLARALIDGLLQPDLPLSSLVALRDRDDRQLIHSVNVACLVGRRRERSASTSPRSTG